MSLVHRLIVLLLGLLPLCAAESERWTTSRIQGSPEPPHPFLVERVFPSLTFKNPLDAVTIPGTRRMAIVEQYGKIYSIPENRNATEADLLIDLKQFDPEAAETYGIAFHPKFPENQFAYVWMVQNGKGQPNRDDGTRIVRFKMLDENPPRLDVKSGQTIFTWLSGGHNGGNLRFGPDGMLYISTGDAEVPDPPDPRKTGQDISDVLASVLRIDVDRPGNGKNYGIPKDNPFVDIPGARGEVWAYGFRNPWRMSFDSRRGDLWVADVGWELWEMIHRVERGGNYGWSITEAGKQDVHPSGARGPTPIQPPLVVHSHDEAASITGGDVYYGARLPELNGAYIYGDWQFGTFWSLKMEGSRVLEHRELARSSLMPAGFGIAPDGELIICDHGGGGLWRLKKNPDADKKSTFPRMLSETGLFADTSVQKPSAGVKRYEIQARRWADHAASERWLGLPNGEKITIARNEQGMLGRGRWIFPTNSVLALTYSLGNKKVETQLTHFDGINWNAYSYRWNDTGTDAELVGAKGEEAIVQGPEGPQPWKFFARSECLRCHTVWNNFTPGFNGPQLAPKFVESLGLKDGGPALADPHGDGPLDVRARSYLHANCSVCHRQAGGGAVRIWLNAETGLKDSRMLDKPVAGDLGLPDARVVAPGAPERSVLLYRVATGGRGHMPYLGGKLNDDKGILLLRDWIASLGPKTSAQPNFETADGALLAALAVVDKSLQGDARKQAIERGAALPDPLRRDLFERFLPPEQRRKALGPQFSSEKLLSQTGNASRGQELFAAICATCHKIENTGADFGPNLSQIGRKYDRPRLLEQIREPGKIIEPDWFPATIKLPEGDTLTGFLTNKTLKLAGGFQRELTSAELKAAEKTRATLMPEGLLENLTQQEAADLLEFLASRR